MTEFGEASEIARAAGAEPPVLELRGDEVEAVSMARKGAFFYRARHGRAGEKRARELEEFAEAAFAWQHSEGGSGVGGLELDAEGYAEGGLVEDGPVVGELVESSEGAHLEEDDVDLEAGPVPVRRAGPTAKARRAVRDRPQA